MKLTSTGERRAQDSFWNERTGERRMQDSFWNELAGERRTQDLAWNGLMTRAGSRPRARPASARPGAECERGHERRARTTGANGWRGGRGIVWAAVAFRACWARTR